MKNNNLFARIRREAASSPKKAIILGILFLVAVVYWTPLIYGWVAPESSKKTAKETTPAAASKEQATPAVLPVKSATETETKKQSWKKTSQWIDADPRMTTPGELPARQHPFAPVQTASTESSENQTDADGNKTAKLLTDPKSLGVVLTSTLIGSRGQAALINGKTYQLGEFIRVEYNNQPIDFELIEIRDNSIVLKRNNIPYEIHLQEPKPSGRLEITPLTND